MIFTIFIRFVASLWNLNYKPMLQMSVNVLSWVDFPLLLYLFKIIVFSFELKINDIFAIEPHSYFLTHHNFLAQSSLLLLASLNYSRFYLY
jgi:hypothetical protein